MKSHLFLLSIVAMIFFFECRTFAHDHHEAAIGGEKLSSGSLYNLSSDWQTQEGKTIKLKALQGHPVVIAMAYTSCPSSCPLIVNQMKQLQSKLPQTTGTVFVLASFDSKRDLPAKLKKYAEQRKLDEQHWFLLHGSRNSVQELAATLGIRYTEDSDGDFDHSNLISVLDSKGVIRFQQAGLNSGVKELQEKISDLESGRP